MRSATHTGVPAQDDMAVTRQAEAYLARLPDIAGEDIKTMLADGMVLVSNLLCGTPGNTPEHENHRKLASLVLAKMQRITRETSLYGKPASYPCFTA